MSDNTKGLLLGGIFGFLAGIAVGAAKAVKELEFSSEWYIDAPVSQVYQALREIDSYHYWWPALATRTNSVVAPINHNLMVRCSMTQPVSFLQGLPPLRFTIRFPNVEKDLRIRARFTGDIAGIAEWVVISQAKGTLVKSNSRLRVTNPLTALALLFLPEAIWRSRLEATLAQARDGLRRRLEQAEQDRAFERMVSDTVPEN